MDDQVEELRRQLEETEMHLQKAAEFGSELLEKNQTYEAEREGLEQRLEAREAEITYLHEQLERSQQSNETLRLQITALKEESKQNKEASESESREKTLQANYKLAQDQLRQVTAAHKQLSEEVSEKDSMLIKYRGIDKELLKYREQNEDLIVQKEELEKTIERLEGERAECKRDLSNLKVELKKADEKYDQLQLENSEIQLRVREKGSSEKGKLSQALADLEEAENEIENLEKALEDVQEEKKQLEKTITQIALENQKLHKEHEEHVHFLEEARASLVSYRKREEESEFQQSMSLPDLADDSILGELEMGMEHLLVNEQEVVKPKKEKKAPPPDAPANCEEFFFLAATAVKIAFAVQAPKTSDGCFRININSLYQQALDAEVPFHEWYDWIKLQLASKQESLVSSVTSDPNSPVNRVPRRPRKTVRRTQPPASPKRTGWMAWLKGE